MKQLFSNCGILAWKNNDFCWIPKGFVGIDGSLIHYVGAERPKEDYDMETDLTGRILMPGLINCHCHAAMTLLRGVGSDLPLDRWLFEKIFPVEDKLTAEDIRTGNELAMMEMIAFGVTSFSDMYMEPRTAIESNESIGMKISLGRVMQSFDPAETAETSPRVPEAISLFKEMNGAQDGRIRIDFLIHAEYTIHDRAASGFMDRVRQFRDEGAVMQIHLSETRKEHEECIQRHGLTPVAWSEKMGVFDLPAAAAHCVWVTPEDMEIMLRHGVSPVHNPSSNMKLGSGFAPVPKMLEMGLNVALGTDGAASNNNLNMFEEMHLASVIHNGYHGDAVIMPPDQVLKMATVNGARLQGRTDTGCIEVGKKADLIAVDFRRPHMFPALDPMALLVYSAQASDVCMTMVDGRILYRNGEYLTLDAERVLSQAKKAAERLYGGER